MAESIDRINALLEAARASREEAERELAQTQAKVDQIDSIQLEMDVSFPKTTEKLAVGKENLTQMKDFKAKAESLAETVNVIIEGIAGLDDLRKKAVVSLKAIGLLDSKQKFAEAMVLVDELENQARTFESEVDLVTRRHILEITAWTRCALWDHMADANIAEGKYSLPPEEFAKYEAAVNELPLGFHTQEAKDIHVDKIFGFRCYDRGLTTLNSPRSMDDLQALLALLEEANKVEKHTVPTLERINYLRGVACEEYNRLANQYFDLDRNYDRARDLFNMRGYFEEAEIAHDDYRLAKDEPDFHLRFLDKEALRDSDDEFSVAVYAYADSIQKEDEFEFEILCRYSLLNGLSSDKVTFLLSAINRMSFELEVLLLGNVVERGLAPDRQELIFVNLLARKDKTLNLDNCAKALLNCKTKMDEPLRPTFERFLEDLLRSPHARKVITKSTKPETHALVGEDIDAFKRPWGKAVKNPVIKSWDFFNKVMFVTFAAILPAVVLAGALVLIYVFLRENQFVSYFLLIPLVLEIIHIHLLIVGRFGRDERGSAVYRRILGLLCLACSAFSLVYFIMPQTLTMLRTFAFTSLIFAGGAGLWGFFAYADRKKKVTAFIYVPLLLCTIAAIVMMVVAMSNGLV